MRFPEIMILVAGLLQFIVAGYALRLNRLFGSARVGWSLFWAFMLLALLHLVQFAVPFHNAGAVAFGNEISVMYALISLLLLIGMMHLETVLKERIKLEEREHAMRTELELEVKKKTAYLTRAMEGLQAEIDERKRMEAEVETTHIELRAVARQAEMARLATDVLQRVGNMIKSVNVSVGLVSDQVKQSKIANVVHVGELIRQHKTDLGKFMADDPRGQKLPEYIAQLAEHLGNEQHNLLDQLKSLNSNLENVLTTQQDFTRLAGITHSAEVTAMIQESFNQREGWLAARGLSEEIHEDVMEVKS